MKKILYLSDLYFEAKGRKYYEEDLYITSRLSAEFNILIGNPNQAIDHLDIADLVIFRNTGAVIAYQDYFDRFLAEVNKKNINTFNSFDGKADIKGKQYLLDLMKMNFPVTPTVSSAAEIEKLGDYEKFIVKLMNGADSIGMEIMTKNQLLSEDPKGKLIQPFLDFDYEVSFYYLDDRFQYAFYAPDKTQRWKLEEYIESPEDLRFADQFIKWNNMRTGITRVDACRMKDGSLLLVELEDLNPFLSIGLLSENKRNFFIKNWIEVLKKLV